MNRTAKLLLKQKLISRQQYESAYLEYMAHGGTIGYHLVKQDAIDAEQLANFLAKEYHLPRAETNQLVEIPDITIEQLSSYICKKHRVLPVQLAANELTIAVTEPAAEHALKEAQRIAGKNIKPMVASEADMTVALDSYFSMQPSKPSLFPGEYHPKKTSRVSTIPIGISIEDALSQITLEIPAANEPTSPSPQAPSKIKLATPKPLPTPITPTPDTLAPLRKAADSKADKKKTDGEILQAIASATESKDVVSLALEYLLRFSNQAIFFVVNHDLIRGFGSAGDGSSSDSIKSFWIPYSARSTLAQVANTGQQYLGPIGAKPADAIFCAAIGGRPKNALVIPIIIRARTVGLLFADHAQSHNIAWPRLVRLVNATQKSLEQQLTQKQVC